MRNRAPSAVEAARRTWLQAVPRALPQPSGFRRDRGAALLRTSRYSSVLRIAFRSSVVGDPSGSVRDRPVQPVLAHWADEPERWLRGRPDRFRGFDGIRRPDDGVRP